MIDELELPVSPAEPVDLNHLKQKTREQIGVLSQQSATLDGISTDLKTLITRYNAQKSYLGYAAQWYGEQEWWLQITVSIIGAGIGTLLYIPFIISVALSCVVSFLLLEHYQFTTVRDQLIITDLERQNSFVETIKGLLLNTKASLEDNLAIVWQMAERMNEENGQLKASNAAMSQEVETYKELTKNLQASVTSLQEKEATFRLQITGLQEELEKSKALIESGTAALSQSSAEFQSATASLLADATTLRQETAGFAAAAQQLRQTVSSSSSPPRFPVTSFHPSPTSDDEYERDQRTATALRTAEQLGDDIDDLDLEQGIARTEEQFLHLSPSRNKGLGHNGST